MYIYFFLLILFFSDSIVPEVLNGERITLTPSISLTRLIAEIIVSFVK